MFWPPLPEQTAKLGLDYVSVLAKQFHNNQLTPALVSGLDITEGALDLIDEAEKSNVMKRVGSAGIMAQVKKMDVWTTQLNVDEREEWTTQRL